ncbi:MAG: excinuclease ABC subunit UvrC [Candidatus Wallbacteria bacterium]|nr:excinuclease ABC subunit UvrC [Candidatus Wallbacteria bacterium]
MNRIEQILLNLPNDPGVYLMKNSEGSIIYIGKAKNLRNRVKQYFGENASSKQAMLARTIADLEFVLARNELEALILENNLIKQYKPQYNVMLKDDKTYPYLKVTIGEEFPALLKVRKILRDNSAYFGPFPHARYLDKAREILLSCFGLRPCLKIGKKVCLYHHLKKCPGICEKKISSTEYRIRVDKLLSFLHNQSSEALRDYQERMELAKGGLNFEEAARYRDLIQVLRMLWGKSEVESLNLSDVDYFGWQREGDDFFILVQAKRKGKVIRYSFRRIKVQEWESDEEILPLALIEFYEKAPDFPGLIYFPQKTPIEPELLENLFQKQFELKVGIVKKAGEEHKKSGDLLLRNLRFRIDESHRMEDKTRASLTNTAEILSLSKIPERIEGYDISTLGGELSVASMVVFLNGRPDKQSYRKFKMNLQGIDDFGMMREVLSRRLKHPEWPLPDLILIDGGRGQLNAACESIADSGFSLEAISLAKREEEIYTGHLSYPLRLPRHHPVLRLLVRVRDEAHRFAVGFQRKRRQEKFKSVLDDIPGLGKKRKELVLDYFPNIAVLMEASPEELAGIPGISRNLAVRIIAAIRKK